jgi:hypothetical protein
MRRIDIKHYLFAEAVDSDFHGGALIAKVNRRFKEAHLQLAQPLPHIWPSPELKSGTHSRSEIV